MGVIKDRIIIVVAICFVIAVTAAYIICISLLDQAHAQGAGVRQACRADYQQFCSGVLPGGGRIAACLKGHTSELSPECQQALGKALENRSRQ